MLVLLFPKKNHLRDKEMTILCIFAIQTSVPLKFRSETTPFSKGVASKTTKLAISKKKYYFNIYQTYVIHIAIYYMIDDDCIDTFCTLYLTSVWQN